jgi:hypothetical protein
MTAHAYIERRGSLSPTGYPHYEVVARVYVSRTEALTLANAIRAEAQLTGRMPAGVSSTIRGQWDDDGERISDILEVSVSQLIAERNRTTADGTSLSIKLEAALAAMQALGDDSRLVFWISM